MDYYKDKLEILLKCLLILILLVTSADAATLTVGPGETYTTIQSAINAASPGDTIEVQSGTYNEHVVVNKQLTLRGNNTGGGLPVVDAGGSGNTITISADDCILEGFVAIGSGAYPGSGIKATSSGNTITGNTATGNSGIGIYLYSSSSNTITGNTASGNTNYGIYLASSSNGNTLSGNTATGNGYGIYLGNSDSNTLSGNTATSNTFCGIYLLGSNDNTITGNTATGNTNYGIFLYSSSSNTISGNTATGNTNYGIYLDSSSGNTISGNTATGNVYGIYLDSSSNGNTLSGNTATSNTYGIFLGSSSNGNTLSGNTATGNPFAGICLYSSSSNTITGNTATGNTNYGIYLDSSRSNTISGNTANGNTNGILLAYSSNGNTLSGNTANGNTYGIVLDYSSSNTIYLNTLDNAWSNGANHWNATTTQSYEHNGRILTGLLGNIWSDYTGFDCDGDGIGDTPYLIEGGSEKDLHPIGGKQPGLEVEKLADRSEAKVGDWISYTIHVNNTGNVSLTGVRAEDNLTSAVWTVGDLAPGQNYTDTTRYQVKLSDLPGPLTNKLWANGTDPCSYEVNNSSFETVDISYLPQIIVNKTANLTGGTQSTVLCFNIEVNNTGNADFDSVYVEDLLPVGLDYLSDDSGLTLARAGNRYTWDLGRLNCSDSFSFNLTARINGDRFGDLVNVVNATGDTGYGDPANSSSTASVLASKANISVTKSADPASGSKGTPINFTLTVTNNGTATLSQVFVSDLLPAGLTYDSSDGGMKSGRFINWTNIGPLAPAASRSLWIKATIDGSAYGTITNQVNVTGTPEHGDPVSSSATASVASSNICLSGHKFLASTGAGLAGWNITAADSVGIVSNATTDSAGYWEICNISVGSYTVSEQLRDGWTQVSPKGSFNVVLENESISHLDFFNDLACNLTLTKTADVPVAHRGEEITYTIELSNPCGWGSYTNVTLWDILPQAVELVSVSPAPSSSSSTNLTWDIGTLGPGQDFEATIVVRVPIVDINYDASETVRGTGFVNVHNDYDTHQGPESVTNCAYAKADLVETLSSCASTRIVDPGTELQSRESGSGAYESEELIRMRTENKSIRSISNLSAVHRPTTFSLPQNRSINYATKWTDKSRGINTITGASMNEEYTLASKIDNDRSIELDRNGSTMKTEVEFLGSGHIGVLKKQSPDAHPKSRPIFESAEDFVGSFKVFEMVDEYGSSVKSNKSVTGYGYAAVDKRVQGSQRTYESGTGSYQSDEIIDTPSNYIAKDISLVHGPTSYNYTPRFNVSQNMLWSEGMWSRSGYLAGGDIFKDSSNCGLPVAKVDNSSPPASYISERYSSLDYLKKDSVALGLNEMKTNASFSGQADFEAKSIGENQATKVDNEERYVGQYNIARKVLLTGVSKYDRPHITVQKVGNMTTRWFNKTNALVARYVITITNDGNVALAPINVRDIFPPGTEYIGSSIRPASLSQTDANWTLVHIGIGNTMEIELELNLTEYAPGNIVNRVMVCGMNGDTCVSGAAYATLESAELPCCLPEVRLDKRAVLDATDATLVHFTIEVSNNAESTVAATLTDMLPAGLTFLSASPEPSRQEGQFLEWIVPDLQPDGVVVIEYQARATRDGSYVNSVHLDATAVDGTGYDTEDAAARVEVWSSGVAPRTTRYGGWQPPNWNMTSPDQGITIELSPNEDLVE